jgi:hypothetical protein
VPVESVAVPQGLGGQEDRLKEITRAIAHGNALSVDYAAKTRRIAMTFSPHTIVRTPDRIHVRGHASEDATEPGYFMDLVPARMLDASNLGHDNYVGDADDVDWHRHESLTVRLRSDLPEPLRDALLQEHGGDTIKIHRVRKALHRYYRIAFESRRVENVDGPLWIVED